MFVYIVNEVPYIEETTRRLVLELGDGNGVFYGNYDYMPKYYDRYGDKSEKEVYKEVFGPHLLCKNYTYRNWIWTFCSQDKTAIVYFLVNVTGTSFECPEHMKEKDLFTLLVALEDKILLGV